MLSLMVGCLGTSGWLATETRETACYLVPFEDSVILLDSGTGMRRLLNPPEVFRRAKEVYVFITHYHLDHTVGLIYAPAVFCDKKVTFYLPSERFSGVNPRDFLRAFFGSFFFPVALKDLPFELAIKEFDEGDLEIGRCRARVWKQVHTPFSAGIALENQVGYMTDTVFDPDLAVHIAGLPLVLIAVMFDQQQVGNPADFTHNGHMTSEGTRILLREARPMRAYAIHVSPLYSPAQRTQMIEMLKRDGIAIREAVDGEWIPEESLP